jgi:hypothetical protein
MPLLPPTIENRRIGIQPRKTLKEMLDALKGRAVGSQISAMPEF